MMLLGACNRDPRHFENPNVLDVGRHNAREHIAFGRGIGACPGGPLARAEAVVTLSPCSTAWPASGSPRSTMDHRERRNRDDPTYSLRRISELHLEFTPIG